MTNADDLESVGQSVFDLTKHLPEDTVDYTLLVIPRDHQHKPTSTRERLETVRESALSLVEKLLQEYIWQREHFHLDFSKIGGHLGLHGRTNYGDSIDDEWLIVYLLRELSSTFPDLWVKVNDTDGDFLLVEAANELPQWLVPEIAENRVWIHEGKLCIIPIDDKAPSAGVLSVHRALTIGNAIEFISTRPDSLLRSPNLEAEAFYRLRKYPTRIAESMHHVAVTLPRRLACILHLKPNTISPAVEAFYLRDPIALRPLLEGGEKVATNLYFPAEDLVTVSVRFSKTGYAQLTSQHFAPPPTWTGVFAKTADSVAFRRLETGTKVTSGFEMLVSDPQTQERDVVRQIKLLLQSMKEGNIQLPSDDEIEAWHGKQDDEGWLDINYEDLEHELSKKAADGGTKSAAFGDSHAHENLQRLVQRFESFLNDESAGIDGVEDLGSEDDDDGSLSTGDDEDDVSFNEADFTSMMREMMGLPPQTGTALPGASGDVCSQSPWPGSGVESARGEDEAMQQMMADMEAELRCAGALELDRAPPPKDAQAKKDAATTRRQAKAVSITEKAAAEGEEEEEEEEEEPATADSDDRDDEVEVDYNLAKNLLESFGGQAGLPGPGGNLLASLGILLPRDEPDDHGDGPG